MIKPPYRVPSMDEVRAVPPNGYLVASTFSGCGGSCLGFKMAGFRHVFASEFVDAARETYAANFPGVHVDGRDIRQVQPEDVLGVAGVGPGQLDVLEGSPPCASFSTAGKRSKGWGQVKAYSDTSQRTDDLFFEFIRLLRGIKPRTFVAENVAGLVRGVAKGYFLDILRELTASGYRVECRLLDAQWLGVPQQRQRTIFMGVRDDLGVAPAFPAPLPYRYTIRDALGIDAQAGVKFRFRTGWQDGKEVSPDDPAPTIMAGGIGGSGHGQFEVCALKTAKGEKSIDEPAPTILTHARRHTHNELSLKVGKAEPRRLTIDELRRLGGFPDDFVLTGTYGQQWERIGRAVPPVMMSHVARVLRDDVLAKVPR